MKIHELLRELDLDGLGREMHAFMSDVFPLCRSITGEGLRATLRAVGERVPLEIHEVPTGTEVLDWTVPREWNIRDAWIRDAAGRRVVDFRASSLHVVSYSVPVRSRMSLAELRPHLHALPEHPDWIPYRTSYYREDWGFCLTQRQLDALRDGAYEVCIDSTLEDGHLSYGECLLEGRDEGEVLLVAHACHPALANENLSGVALLAALGSLLARVERRWTYRLLFLPTTIGSITWLHRNRDRVDRIRHGLIVACVGDPGPFTYKRSRRGDAEVDRAAVHVLRHSGRPHRILDFSPYGFDERQFCSPGFDLPVGGLTRSRHDEYPEYHTSADDLDLVRPERLAESLDLYLQLLDVLERDRLPVSTRPYGEPQLGRRGLYRSIGGAADGRARELPLLWVLSFADGRHSLLDIAERAGLPFDRISAAAEALIAAGLLEAER